MDAAVFPGIRPERLPTWVFIGDGIGIEKDETMILVPEAFATGTPFGTILATEAGIDETFFAGLGTVRAGPLGFIPFFSAPALEIVTELPFDGTGLVARGTTFWAGLPEGELGCGFAEGDFAGITREAEAIPILEVAVATIAGLVVFPCAGGLTGTGRSEIFLKGGKETRVKWPVDGRSGRGFFGMGFPAATVGIFRETETGRRMVPVAVFPVFVRGRESFCTEGFETIGTEAEATMEAVLEAIPEGLTRPNPFWGMTIFFIFVPILFPEPCNRRRN